MTAADAAPRRGGVDGSEVPARPPLAWGPLKAISAAVSGLLVATSAGYGYHRDELYFLAAGRHLAWGYPDQPPLTPLLARAASEVFGDSLVGLRLAPALAAGLVVLLTGLLAREFGGARAEQALGAGCMAVASFLLAVGHLLSTATFDLLAWTAVSWLVVRALRTGGPSWLLAGLAGGLGLQNKSLLVFLLAGIALGLLVVGPRSALRSPWPWAAGGLALLIWAPNLVWQATHGWPQLELSSAIAAGSSGSSQPWWLFLPFQLLLVSPVLAPVWVAGLWRLARDPELRAYRAFAGAYPLLAVAFLVTGGKPYYLAGLYPVLLAAGAVPTLRWVRAKLPHRRVQLGAALGLSALVAAVLMLPVVPVRYLAATPITDIYYDAGETVGWPELVRAVAGAYAGLPADQRGGAIVLTRNYGQAGAVEHLGPALGLPAAYSGHNGYAEWGPPPDPARTAVVVGYDAERLGRWFGSVQRAARVDNGVGLDNDEQGTPVWICRRPLADWSELWPQIRHLG